MYTYMYILGLHTFLSNYVHLKFPGRDRRLRTLAAILRTLRDPRMLPVCSNVTTGECPVQTLG